MYGGTVLSCSVGMRAWAMVAATATPGVMLETGGETCPIVRQTDLRLQGDRFDVARAVLSDVWRPLLRCRVQYASEIPLQSGLSGSTALIAAILQALLTWQGDGERLNRYRLAERARYIEFNRLEVVCGYQDAYMCVFGGLNYMEFGGKQFDDGGEIETGIAPFAVVENLDAHVPVLPFVLGYTGVPHASGAVHRPIRERWLAGEPAVMEGYRRITQIARAGKKALLMQDWPLLGRLMNENHAIQRDLGGSGGPNERLIAAALASGALGAKLAGAGHGGTVIALWPWTDAAPLEEALREAGAAEIYRLEPAPGVRVERMPDWSARLV
jgi:galactokinase/mevalonate kinase-like predicted kinase